MNNLRSRIAVETDGQLKTGRDVVVAALLGAEEFGFATAPLVATGCIMMRVCHLNTCPAGVATQDPQLREKFAGKPEHVVNFMRFIAMEMRELMAQLGFRTVEEMVGRVDKLEARKAIKHWKAKGLDFSNLLYSPDAGPEIGRFCQIPQDHGLEKSLDLTTLLELCKPAIERGEKVRAELPIRNVNRVVGTITGSEITRKYGAAGLPEDTIELNFKGSAGQSFGAFVPRGMTLRARRRCQRLRRQGLVGRQDHHLRRPRTRRSRRTRTSSSATSRCTARPAARRTSTAWRASASAYATAACMRSSKPWAITAAST